jgi:hypothetical protein
MVTGVIYWAGWRILLPKVFGYELVPRKETLPDGTVITLVRSFPSAGRGVTLAEIIYRLTVFEQEDPPRLRGNDEYCDGDSRSCGICC